MLAEWAGPSLRRCARPRSLTYRRPRHDFAPRLLTPGEPGIAGAGRCLMPSCVPDEPRAAVALLLQYCRASLSVPAWRHFRRKATRRSEERRVGEECK